MAWAHRDSIGPESWRLANDCVCRDGLAGLEKSTYSLAFTRRAWFNSPAAEQAWRGATRLCNGKPTEREELFAREFFVATVAETLVQAKAHHCAGQLQDAERSYARIVQVDPGNVEAHYLLGVARHALGKLPEAAASLSESIRLSPQHAEAHHRLGAVLAAQGQLDAAICCFQTAWRLNPQCADVGRNLHHALAVRDHQAACALTAQGRLLEAVDSFRRAVEHKPDYVEAHNNLAIVLAEQGKFYEAAGHFRLAVQLAPDFAEAHTNLGVVLAEQNQLDQAVACHRRALELNPNDADAHNNMGNVLERLDQLDEATACFRQSLELRPDCGETHYNLGNVMKRLGRFDEAATCYRRALELKPDCAAAFNNLGTVLEKQGRLDDALVCYRRAIELKPDYADVHFNLGVALEKLDRLDEAAACYMQAVELKPTDAEAHNNLGFVLGKQGCLDEAVSWFRQALRLKPEFAEAHNNLGFVLEKQGLLDEATDCFRRALELKPEFAEASNNLGFILEKQGQFDLAIACYRQALSLKPDLAQAHTNLGFALLRMGDFLSGWSEHEWRWQRKGMGEEAFSQPRWSGSDLAGKTVLLHSEQGLGDTLQFVRYAELVKQRGATVLVECPRVLTRLIASCPGVDGVIASGEVRPPFDMHVPLLSLPGIFRTTLGNIPANVPYLSPAVSATIPLPAELDDNPSFKIGIAWQGSRVNIADPVRSIPFAEFAPLAALAGVRLYSLQMGDGREQLQAVNDAWPIVDLGDQLGDFNQTAAIMRKLDLIVSCDSAPAHLAGAIGAPVWVALAYVADWRWLVDRNDTPWYPNMRLFRQARAGDWQDVFQSIAEQVAHVVSEAAGRSRSVTV